MSLPLDQEGEEARSGAIHNCLSLVIELLDPTAVTRYLDI